MTASIDHSTANPANSTLPLFQLPLELLLRITYFLSTEDLGRFRSSCKRAEESLHHKFVQEFFTCRVFALNEFSLQALIDISESRYGKCIRTLDFSIIIMDYTGPRDGHSFNDAEAILGRQLQAAAVRMFNGGQHTAMLQRAFESLSSLEVVRFRQRESPTRHRDGPYQQWRPYGAATRQRLLSKSVSAMRNKLESTTLVFNAVITALGLAKVSSITSIDFVDVEAQDAAFKINDYEEKLIQPVLDGVTCLYLCLHGQEQYLSGSEEMFLETRRFLSRCKSVTSLRINGSRYEHTVAKAFMDLTSPDTAFLPNVETLEIGFATYSTQELLDCVRKFASNLKSLKLWKVTLNDWVTTDIQSLDYDDVLCWKRFLRKLQTLPGLNLRTLELGGLKVAIARFGSSHFVNLQNGRHTVKYTGPLWSAFIGDILPHVESITLKAAFDSAKNPPQVAQGEDDEMDSDEEGDEEGDEETIDEE